MILLGQQGSTRYIGYGLSTETKPVNKPINSLFIESDTGNSYLSDGTNWNLQVNEKTIKSLTDFPTAVADVNNFKLEGISTNANDIIAKFGSIKWHPIPNL